MHGLVLKHTSENDNCLCSQWISFAADSSIYLGTSFAIEKPSQNDNSKIHVL